MVNWKSSDALDRLVGALIAAHSELKLDYHRIAAMYGRGATYDAVEGRFRKYRKVAEDLKEEAASNGVVSPPRGGRHGTDLSTPRTPKAPRGPKDGITKSPSEKTGKLKSQVLTTPTKSGKKLGQSILDAIMLDMDSAEMAKGAIKTEPALSGAIPLGDESTEKIPKVEKTEEDENEEGIHGIP